MNKVFKVIWNKATQTWVAVSELARGVSKSSTGNALNKGNPAINVLKLSLISMAILGISEQALANPQKAMGASNATDARNGNDSIKLTDFNVPNNTPPNGNTFAFNATAAGSYAQATRTGTAYGGYAQATGLFATALGGFTRATEIGASAIGVASKASGYGSVSLGYESHADGRTAIAVGAATYAKGEKTIAMGQNAYSEDEYSIAIGQGTKQDIDYAQADKDRTHAKGVASIAFGRKAKTDGDGAVSIGDNSVARQDASVAVGKGTEATGKDSVAVGVGADANNTNTVAVGKSAKGYHLNAVAIGYNATANKANSIALGANSEAGAQSGNAYLTNTAANANNGVLSVGKSGAERRIVNVADGSADSDVTTVRQLRTLAEKTITFQADSGTDIQRKLGETLEIKANDRWGSGDDRYTGDNLKVIATGNKILLGMKNNPTFNSIFFSSDPNLATRTGPTIDSNGINMGNTKIEALKDGTADTDAVNYGQVKNNAHKSLNNIDAAGKNVIKGLVKATGTNGITVTEGSEGEAKKFTVSIEAATKAKIDNALDKTTAANTYLTKTDAGNTYLTKTDAGTTYLTKTDAGNTYVTKTEAGNYANKNLGNIDTAGKNVIKDQAMEAVKVEAGTNVSVTSNTDAASKHSKTYTVSISNDTIKAAAGTTNLASEYAKADASNISNGNVAKWKEKLGVSNLNFSYKTQGGAAKTTSLSTGLNFTSSDLDITAKDGGEVAFALKQEAKNAARDLVDVTKGDGDQIISVSKTTTGNKNTFKVSASVDAIKNAAGTTNLATDYAKADASNINNGNVAKWKEKLGVSNLDLHYKANDGSDKTTTLNKGLNFKNGTNTTAAVEDNGVVKFNLNSTLTGITSIAGSAGQPTITFKAGELDVGGARLTNVGKATSDNDAVNKKQLDDEINKVSTVAGKSADKNLSNLSDDGKNAIKDLASEAVKVAPKNSNITVDTKTTNHVTTNTVGLAKDLTGVESIMGGANKAKIELGDNAITVNKKITGLADATLSDSSTDAVTGKQLNATNKNIETINQNITNLTNTTNGGLKFAGDRGGDVTTKLGEKLTVDGEGNFDSSGSKSATDNIDVVADPASKKLTVKLAKNLQNIETIGFKGKDGEGTLGIGKDGLTYKDKNNTVSNIVTEKTIGNQNISYKANNSSDKKSVALKDGFNFTNGTNTTAVVENNGVVKFNLNSALNDIASIAGGANKAKIELGDNAITVNKKITGLADATIDDNSTDAVTGKQLKAQKDDLVRQINTINNSVTSGKLVFSGNDTNATIDRKLGQTLTIKGDQEANQNIVSAKNNIDVAKDGDSLVVKLNKNLQNIETIGLKGADGSTGTIGIDGKGLTYKGADGTTNNIVTEKTIGEQSISYKANGATDKKSVKLKDGFNFTNGTNTTAVVENNGVVKFNLNPALTGITSIAGGNGKPTISFNDGNTLDIGGARLTNVGKATGETDAVNKKQLDDEIGKVSTVAGKSADKDLSNLSNDGSNKVKDLAGEAVKVASANTNIGVTSKTENHVTTHTLTLAKDLTGVDSIMGAPNKAKITLGDAISVNSKKITGLADAKIDANSTDAVAGKQLHEAKQELSTEIQTKITNLTNGGLKFKDAHNAEITTALGSTLNVDGEGSFAATADNTAKDNIDVVADKDSKTLTVKLAKNLQNIETIGFKGKDGSEGTLGIGKDGLTYKGKDGTTNNIVTEKNIGEQSISYKANSATDKKSIKLKDGFNFTNGTNTTAVVENNGVVKFNLNDSLTGLKSAQFTDNANANTVKIDGNAKSITGLEARDLTSDKYGTNDNKTRAATEGALKALADTVSQNNTGNAAITGNGKDGKDGKAGSEANSAGSKGATGQDGLNGKDLTSKINALRNGEAGSVVYTNENGERLAKANDGKYYPANKVNADGSAQAGATAVDNPIASLVNADGSTTSPTTMGNVKHNIMPANVDATTAGTAVTGLTTKTNGLNNAATVGDLKTIALAGLDFTGNKTDEKVHRNLGQTLTIKGDQDAGQTITSAKNNIDVAKDGDSLVVKLNKNLQNIESIGLKGKDGKSGTIGIDGDGNITYKNGDNGDASKIVTEKNIGNQKLKYAANTDAAKEVALSSGLKFTNGTNTTAEVGDNGVVKFNLNKDLTGVDSIMGAAGKAKITLSDNISVNSKKITGLADADLSENSTDAVTGKQLSATNKSVQEIQTNITNLTGGGVKFAGDHGAEITTPLGQTLNVKGEDAFTSTADNTAKGNIDVVADAASKTLTVKLAKNLQNIETIGFKGKDGEGTLGIGKDGLTYKGADGKTSNIVTEKTIGEQTISYTANDTADKKSVKLKDGFKFTNGTNTTAEVGDNGLVKFNLNKDLRSLDSAGKAETAKVTFGDDKTVSITADDKAAKFAKDDTGVALTGLTTRDRNSTNYGTGDNKTRAATEGALKELVTTLGLDGANGNNGAAGNNANTPAGKDGLNGKSIVEKVEHLRDGTAGAMVYTDAEGNRLVKDADGKYYKMGADGNKTGDAVANDKIRHSLVNVNGETKDAPSILSNAGSTLGIEGKSTSTAITEADAKTKTADLLTKAKTDLSNVATLGELQAVAQAGLDFNGNDENNIHRPLGTKLEIVGEGVNKAQSATFKGAAGNINVVKNGDKLEVKLNKDLQNLSTVTLNAENGADGAAGKSVTLGVNDKGNITIKDPTNTAADAAKELATKDDLKDSVGNVVLNVTADKATADGEASKASVNLKEQTLALNGTADEIVSTADKQGVTFKLADKVKTDIANALAGKGKAADGRDGKDGTNPSDAASKGATGKDGLNGKDLTTKVNALRNGEAGSVVYTDQNGNRLAKANDGKYYPANKVGADGTAEAGANAVDNPIASLVNADGSTTKATTMGNVAHNIMPEGGATAANAGTAVTTLTGKTDGLNNAATVGDLKTIALAGLDFNGNNSDTKVHRNLGTKLEIVGEGVDKDASAAFKGASGNINVVGEESGKLTVKLNKNLQNIETIGLSKDGKNGTIGIDGEGNITYKNGDNGDASKIVTEKNIGNQKLKYAANADAAKEVALSSGLKFTNGTNTTAVVENDGVVKFNLNKDLTGLTSAQFTKTDGTTATVKIDGDAQSITGLAERDRNTAGYGTDKTRAATEGALKELVTTLGLDGNNGNNGVDNNTGPAGKDGLNGKSIIEKVEHLRDGTAGAMVYTDAEGNRLVKGNDGKYYQKDDLNADGTPKENKSAVANPIASVVNPNGETNVATTLGNVAHNIMPADVSKDNAGAAVTTLTEKTSGLNNAATVGDLKTVALAGLDFAGNNSDTKVHRNLGTQLEIVGEGVTKEAADKFASATGNINVVGEESGKLTVKLNKNLQNIETIGLKSKDGKDGTIGFDGNDLTVTTKDPADATKDITTKVVTEKTAGDQFISYRANNETDKKSVKLKDGFKFTNGTNTTAVVENDGVVKFNLNSELTGITSIANETAKVELNKDNKNVVITADGKGLTIAKANDGVALTGLEARTTETADYGIANRAATEAAVKAVADNVGKANKIAGDGKDGRDGKDGKTDTTSAGSKGATGKDGLNGTTLTEKVNALRNGEAGSLVYTNENGERLVKGNDGKYYLPADLDDKGNPKAKDDGSMPTAATTVMSSLVNPNGETKHPTAMGNVASGLGLANMPAGTTANTAPTNTAIAADKAQEAVKGLLDKADKTLNNVATIGDLQAVAQAGLDFGTNSGDAKGADDKAITTIHKALSSKLEIVGEAKDDVADDKFSGDNVRTFVKDGKVVIRLNKDIKTDSAFVGKDGKNGVSIAGKEDGVNGASGKDGEIKIVKEGADGAKTDVVNIYGKDGVGHIGLNGKDGTSADIFIDKAPADVTGTEITRIKYTDKDNTQHQVATLTDGVKFGGDNTKDKTENAAEVNVVKRKLNERVDIVGGITETDKLTDNNIGVVADSATNKLTIKLAKDVRSLTSVGANDKSKVSFDATDGSETVTITTNDKTLTIKKDGTGIAITGLTARNAKDNKDNYGQGDNATRAATEAALLAIAGNTANDAADGRNGENSPAGKDGLNGKDLNEKINALRRGEAGSMVYTNENGERVVKAKDGKFYLAKDVKEDGNVKTEAENNGTAPAEIAANNVRLSTVNPNGETTAPTVLANVANGKVAADSKEAVNGSQLKDLADKAGLTVNATDNTKFDTPELTALTKVDGTADTAKTTLRDGINGVAAKVNEGLIFGGDQGTATKQQLGSKFEVKKATVEIAEVTDANVKYVGDNLITKYDNTGGNGTLSIALKEKPVFKSVTAKDGDTSVVIGKDGITYTAKDGQDAEGKDKNVTISIGKDGINAGGKPISNIGEGTSPNDAVNKGQLDQLAAKTGDTSKDGEDGRNGGKNLDGTTNAEGKVGPAGKDGLNGQNMNEKINALRRGEAGSMVYTDQDGNRVVKGEDGKLYAKDDLDGKVYVAGTGYVPADQTDKNADGSYKVKDGVTATVVAAKDKDTPVVHSLVNYDGNTNKPSVLNNVASGLGLEDRPAAAISEDKAKEALNGTTGENGKTGLLAEKGANLNKAATIGDLQAVAQAGLDFAGNDETNLHRPLGNKLNIVGEGVDKEASGKFTSASGNINVTGQGETLTVKLAANLKNIKSIGDDDTSKIAFSKTDKNVVITADDKALTIAKAGEGIKLSGLEARDSVTNEADYGTGDNANRAATEGAVFTLSEKLGGKNIGADGRDGKDGTSGNHGLTGKDGLNGKDLTTKVNALRNGEAGSVVYTDENGKRLAKANDGKYYPADQVKKDGSLEENATPATTVIASIANPNGETTTPTGLGNVASGLGLTGKSDDKGNPVALGANETPAKIGEKAAQVATNKLLDLAGADKLNRVSTIGDLQAVAQAGLNFVGNAGTNNVHRALSTTLKVVGDLSTGKTEIAGNAAQDNIDVVADGTDKLTIRLAAALKNIESLESKIKQGETAARAKLELGDNGVTITHNANGKDESAALTIARDKDATGDNAGISITGLAHRTAENPTSENYGVGDNAGRAATEGAVFEVSNRLGNTNTDGSDGRNGGANGATDGKGAAGKDGLNGESINEKVNALRRGEAGSMVYTDKDGERVVKGQDGEFYKPSELKDKVYVEGKGYFDAANTKVDPTTNKPMLNDGVDETTAKVKPTAEKEVGQSLVNADGSTTKPSTLGNVAHNIVPTEKDGKTPTAQEAVAGLVGKDANDRSLNNAATVGDLKTVAEAGLDFAGNDDEVVHRNLGTKVTIKGEGKVDGNTAANNIKVEKDKTEGANGLTVKLAENLTNIKSVGDGDSKVSFAKDDKTVTVAGDTNNSIVVSGKDNAKNVVITTDGAALTIAKDTKGNPEAGKTENTTGVSITGLAHRTAENPTSADYGVNGNEGRAATEGAVLEVSKRLGNTNTDGSDGRNGGGNGATDGKGAAGKDGLNGESINDKVNALRRGEAGSMVYTDKDGNRVVKGQDGEFYKPSELKDKVYVEGKGYFDTANTTTDPATNKPTLNANVDEATAKVKPTAEKDVGQSLVNADGSTTKPSTLGNVAHNIVPTVADNATTAEKEKASKDAVTALVGKDANDRSLNNAATAGDLKTLAEAGLDFVGNDGKTHRNLGTTLTIKGADNVAKADLDDEAKYSAENLATSVSEDGTVTLKMKKNAELDSVVLSAGSDKPKLVIDTDGKGNATIAKTDNQGKLVEGSTKTLATTEDLANSGWKLNKATAGDLLGATALSADEKINPDDRVVFANGKSTEVVVSKGKDGTAIVTVNADMPMTWKYTDKDGKEYVKAGDGNFYAKDQVDSGTNAPKENAQALTADETAKLNKDAVLESPKVTTSAEKKEALKNSEALVKAKKDAEDAVVKAFEKDAAAVEKALRDSGVTDEKLIKAAVEKAKPSEKALEIAKEAASSAAESEFYSKNAQPEGGKTLGGIAKAEKGDQAVNLDQLNDSGWKLNSAVVEGTNGKVISGNTDATKVRMDESVNINAGHNIEITRNGRNLAIGMTRNPEFGKIKTESLEVTKGISIGQGDNLTSIESNKEGIILGGKPDANGNTARKIQNVAAGTRDTDAVNVGQLKGEVNRIDQRITGLGNAVERYRKRADAGTASVAAMASIPQVMFAGRSGFGVGMGSRDGQNAIAVGYSQSSDNAKHIIKLSAGMDTQSRSTFGLGYLYQW